MLAIYQVRTNKKVVFRGQANDIEHTMSLACNEPECQRKMIVGVSIIKRIEVNTK